MSDSYNLSELDPNSFEHMVNFITLLELGLGSTGFGPGPDGGRDGFFEGEAPYPSTSEHWSGIWYIQSKFHKPHPSTNPQKWLVNQIREELAEFQKSDTKRVWPENWIVVTNIDPSGSPMTGAFDQARKLVAKARPKLAKRFHIWGGRKVLDLLALHPEIARYYAHFLTPGQVLTAFYQNIVDSHAQISSIIRHLVVAQLVEQQYTKLEQAGSAADTRPGIHHLFCDLPFQSPEYEMTGMAAHCLAITSAQNHRVDDTVPDTPQWRAWRRYPGRARTWFIKGGPGQGKSTLTQYLCQIQRAALVLDRKGPHAMPSQKTLAKEIQRVASSTGLWPSVPRIPIAVELKEYAQWFGQRSDAQTRGVLSYLTERLSAKVEQNVLPGTLKRAFESAGWLFVFDGLDEVPSDVKDSVAGEVRHFLEDVLVECSTDALTICTSRPQGYAGQFADLDAPIIELSSLSPEQALNCARPLLQIERSSEESETYFNTLRSAIASPSVREIMTTPLQAHIMAVVVRDGGRPPERRWQLFSNFYQVIKKREANRNLPNKKLAKLLREGDLLLKALHNRLGFELHSRAETSKGAQTSLKRAELQKLVEETVTKLQNAEITETVRILMEATTERLVLVSTPENGQEVRFDIRPLQEFFAAEFFYELVEAETLGKRLRIVAGDAHWREVMHFLLSALVENGRQTEWAVAVNSLEFLDEGSGGQNTRTVYRRLGCGSILAARLLQEGVLEQNKINRQQIRKILEPLFGSTDTHASSLLAKVTRLQSRDWLTEVLIDQLYEGAEAESIGAAAGLAFGMPDQHPRAEEVNRAILGGSASYKACLFSILYPDVYGEGKKFSRWVLKLALDTVLGAEWIDLGLKGIRGAFGILSNDRHTVSFLLKERNMGSEVLRIFEAVLCGDATARERQGHRDHGSERCGVVGVQCQQCERALDYTRWSGATWEELAASPGILQFIYRVFRLAELRTKAALTDLLVIAGDKMEVFEGLPMQVSAYLPFDPWAEAGIDIGVWRTLDDIKVSTKLENDKVVELFEQKRLGRVPRYSIGGGEITKIADWEATIARFPGFALRLFARERLKGDPYQIGEEYLDREGGRTLALKLLEYPVAFLSYPEAWGKLFRVCPNLEENVRARILEVADRPVVADRMYVGKVDPFLLRLPAEASFLPHIVSALVDKSFPKEPRFLHMGGEAARVGAFSRERLEQWAPEFCKSVTSLVEIVDGEGFSKPVKAAAAMMVLLHPEAGEQIRESCQQALVRLYEPVFGPWYIKAVGVCLQRSIGSGEMRSCAVLGELLQLARADYQGRMALDPVFESWRQTSKAPVQSSGRSELWL